MSEKRSTVLIAIDSMSHVEKERLTILNMLSAFVPNAYTQTPRPAFIFKPNQFSGETTSRDIGKTITNCIERAKQARAHHSADVCIYSGIAGMRNLAFGIVAAVHSLGTISIGLVGPLMEEITEEEAQTLTETVKTYLHNDPGVYDAEVDVNTLSCSVQFALEGVMDKTSSRH